MLSILSAWHRQVSGSVQWVRQRHGLVPIRCSFARRDRYSVGSGAQAGLFHNVVCRNYLSQDFAGSDSDRLPTHFYRRLGFQSETRKQCFARTRARYSKSVEGAEDRRKYAWNPEHHPHRGVDVHRNHGDSKCEQLVLWLSRLR